MEHRACKHSTALPRCHLATLQPSHVTQCPTGDSAHRCCEGMNLKLMRCAMGHTAKLAIIMGSSLAWIDGMTASGWPCTQTRPLVSHGPLNTGTPTLMQQHRHLSLPHLAPSLQVTILMLHAKCSWPMASGLSGRRACANTTLSKMLSPSHTIASKPLSRSPRSQQNADAACCQAYLLDDE